MNIYKMIHLGLYSPLDGHTYKIKFLMFLQRRDHEHYKAHGPWTL